MNKISSHLEIEEGDKSIGNSSKSIYVQRFYLFLFFYFYFFFVHQQGVAPKLLSSSSNYIVHHGFDF